MELNIPKEKAIQILEKRKSEIDEYGFEPKVWKHTTDFFQRFYLLYFRCIIIQTKYLESLFYLYLI
jgi:hypothetical protein